MICMYSHRSSLSPVPCILSSLPFGENWERVSNDAVPLIVTSFDSYCLVISVLVLV
jgi:hypothetical protein